MAADAAYHNIMTFLHSRVGSHVPIEPVRSTDPIPCFPLQGELSEG